MLPQSLRRVSAAVLLTVIGLSTVIFTLNQRVVAQTSMPSTARPYPGPAPCNTTLQACIDGLASGDVINIAAGLYITSVTLNKAVSLNGAGAGGTFLQGLPGQRVMTVTGMMTDSTQISNLTIQGGSAGAANGGGVFLSVGAQPLIQNVNVVANSAANGGGIYASSPITLLNITVNNNFATNGSGGGLFVNAGFGGNNVSFIGNSLAKFGTMSGGAHDVNDDPAFINPNGDNYHLGLDSAAIDAGADVGVYTDIDGQTRPQGSGFDIGFDEIWVFRVHLPLILK